MSQELILTDHAQRTGSTARLLGFTAVLVISFFVATQNLFQSARENFGRVEEGEAAAKMEEGSATRKVGFLMLGAFGVACLVAPRNGSLHVNRILTPLVVCFVAWTASSSLWADDPSISFRRVIQFMCFAVGCAGIVRQTRPKDLLWIAFFGGLGQLLIGVASEVALGTFRPWEGGYRFAGTMQPNLQGMNCALLTFAAVWLIPRYRQYTGLLVTAAVIAFVCMFLTKSRSSLAGCMAALLASWLLTDRRGIHIAIAGIAVWGVSMTYIGVGDVLLSSAGEAANMGRTEGEVSSFSGRVPLWTQLLNYAEQRPVLGYGFGGFWTAENVDAVIREQGWVVTSSHNAYVESLLAGGFPGMAMYTTLVLFSLIEAVRRYRKTRAPEWGLISCLLIEGIVHGLMEAAAATFSQYMTLIIYIGVGYLACDTSDAEDAEPRSLTAKAMGFERLPHEKWVWST